MFKKKSGFSLIETVLTIGIISVIGLIASNLLVRTYRTSSDADLKSKLKQNGAVALETLSEAIRMADSVVCYGSNGSIKDRIVIRTITGSYWRLRFEEPGSGNGYIAKKENLNPDELNIFCNQSPITTEEVILTDDNINTGVSISNGKFEVLYGREGKDTVTIKFDVKPAVNQTGDDVVNIQTTVQVR